MHTYVHTYVRMSVRPLNAHSTESSMYARMQYYTKIERSNKTIKLKGIPDCRVYGLKEFHSNLHLYHAVNLLKKYLEGYTKSVLPIRVTIRTICM